MSSNMSENDAGPRLRRSTRSAAAKTSLTLTRPPLKRTKKSVEPQAAVEAVNGSRSVDDGVPSKRRRRVSSESVGEDKNDQNEMDVQEGDLEQNDQNEMDVQEGDLEQNEDHEMDVEEERPQSTRTSQPRIFHGAQGDVTTASSPTMIIKHRPLSPAADKNRLDTKTVMPSAKAIPVTAKSATQNRSSQYGPEVIRTTKDDYRRKMSSKPEISGHSNFVKMIPQPRNTYAPRPNDKDPHQSAPRYPTGKKKVVTSACSRAPSRGLMWYIWRLVLLVLLSSAALLAFKIIPVLQKGGHGAGGPATSESLKAFADALSRLQTRFLSQHPEVWRRSRIHLERHLSMTNPTEPVSLILTAGRRAENTLACLARGMASAFSETFNASVLHIDGASKANHKSDEVKLFLDSELQAAFGGDKPAAVIHRLEELPPGSTLIFYRYCDHENAAYKRVFLLFTVLLPEEEVSGDLKAVEEMVQEYLEEKLVDSKKQASFNEMDIDKYGGLWSRISHLILPVVSEKEVEEGGC